MTATNFLCAIFELSRPSKSSFTPMKLGELLKGSIMQLPESGLGVKGNGIFTCLLVDSNDPRLDWFIDVILWLT